MAGPQAAFVILITQESKSSSLLGSPHSFQGESEEEVAGIEAGGGVPTSNSTRKSWGTAKSVLLSVPMLGNARSPGLRVCKPSAVPGVVRAWEGPQPPHLKRRNHYRGLLFLWLHHSAGAATGTQSPVPREGGLCRLGSEVCGLGSQAPRPALSWSPSRRPVVIHC